MSFCSVYSKWKLAKDGFRVVPIQPKNCISALKMPLS